MNLGEEFNSTGMKLYNGYVHTRPSQDHMAADDLVTSQMPMVRVGAAWNEGRRRISAPESGDSLYPYYTPFDRELLSVYRIL